MESDLNNQISSEHIVRDFRDRPPQSKEELDAYFRYFYGIFLASVPIDDGNSSPLDFAWDIYSSAMGLKKNPRLEDFNFLGMACRSGQKSLTCATIESALLTFDKYRNFFHMASIYEQSKVTYGYVQSIFMKPLMSPIIKNINSREAISRWDKMLKIGTGTIRNVNSFHGSVIQDEVDLTEQQVFIESKGMLSGAPGRSPIDVKISSRKYAFGNIQTLLDRKAKDPNFPLKIHQWGQLEVTERCPSTRSLGEEKTVPIFVDEENLIAVDKSAYDQLPISDRSKYKVSAGFPGCLSCGIFSFCKGNLKKQATDNIHLMSIDDVRRLFFTDDVEFFKAQRLNRRPSRVGLIFGTYNPFLHIKTYEAMYSIFMGKSWDQKEDLTLDLLLKIMAQSGCKIYLGLDFGFNVAVALLIVKDGSDRLYVVDHLVIEGRSDADFALAAWDRWKNVPVLRGFGDVASPGAIQEFGKKFNMLENDVVGHASVDYRTYSKLSKDYNYRFGQIRKLLSAPGTNDVHLYIYGGVASLVDHMGIYHYHIDPTTGAVLEYPANKQWDHGIDALGHGVVGILVAGGGQTKMVIAETGEEIKTNAVGAPTPEDMGVYMDNMPITNNNDIMPSKSGPVDPHTGLPIEPKTQGTSVTPQPRGNKKVRWTFMDS